MQDKITEPTLPTACTVDEVRAFEAAAAPAAVAVSDERSAYEKWLGIKPCGAAHDFGWKAWQARAAVQAEGLPERSKPRRFLSWACPVCCASVETTP